MIFFRAYSRQKFRVGHIDQFVIKLRMPCELLPDFADIPTLHKENGRLRDLTAYQLAIQLQRRKRLVERISTGLNPAGIAHHPSNDAESQAFFQYPGFLELCRQPLEAGARRDGKL